MCANVHIGACIMQKKERERCVTIRPCARITSEELMTKSALRPIGTDS
jgi:hypothetical protein